MYLMADFANFKRTKVKSFIRKGKVVRSYDRSIRDRIRDVAIGATGTALLGGAYLLGKRNGARSLDEVKSLIKNIKPEVTVNVPTPIVNVTNTPGVVREVINNTVKEVSTKSSKVKEVVDNAVKDNVIKVDITRIPLPKRVDNLTEFAINKTTRDAAKMTDAKLEQSIGLVNKRLKKYAESNKQLVYLERLQTSLNQLKTGKHNYTDSYLHKEIILYRDSLGLTKIEPDKLVIESIVDKEYVTRLKKINNRDTMIKQIYQNELTKRRKSPEVIEREYDIERTERLLQDFSSSRKLTLFNDTKSRRSFFLTDTDVPKISKLLNR